ncbi:putative ComEC/Rec2 family protein [Campylobacter fetus subsp. venerealis NCTC 10354]|nr:putative ComEC/Rec2 family protein [Campylobacter fetus subsp. venerealis NCTC 10354]
MAILLNLIAGISKKLKNTNIQNGMKISLCLLANSKKASICESKIPPRLKK